MNPEELSRRFLLSDSALQRMKRFRRERIDEWADVNGRIAGFHTIQLLLHGLPLSAFARSERFNLSALWEKPTHFSFLPGPPPQVNYNFQGIRAWNGDRTGPIPLQLQCFRNGCIELVDPTIDSNRPPTRVIRPGEVERRVCNYVKHMFKLWREILVQQPVFVGVSLLQATNYSLILPRGEQSPFAHQNEEQMLCFSDVQFDDFEADIVSTMRSTFDIFWQSFGYEGFRS